MCIRHRKWRIGAVRTGFDPNAPSSHCTAPTRDDPPGRPEKMNIVLLDRLQSVRARNADSIVRSRPSDPTARSDQRIPERQRAIQATRQWQCSDGTPKQFARNHRHQVRSNDKATKRVISALVCLLYTSDAADDLTRVDL